MKFNQYTWSLYKRSPEGKAAISSFLDRKEWIEEEQILEKYNPRLKESFNKELICDILEDFWCCKVSDYENVEVSTLDKDAIIYEEIISTGLRIEDEEILKIGDFDRMLEYIPFLSMELNYLLGEYFFPYLYIDRFYELKKLADHFEIELPPIPKKPDYKSRCMYYWELCKAFYQFRTENNLTPDELSAFMYDYVPNLLHTEEKSAITLRSEENEVEINATLVLFYRELLKAGESEDLIAKFLMSYLYLILHEANLGDIQRCEREILSLSKDIEKLKAIPIRKEYKEVLYRILKQICSKLPIRNTHILIDAFHGLTFYDRQSEKS